MIPKFSFIKISRLSVFEMFCTLNWKSLKTYMEGWENGTKGYLSIHKERQLKTPEQLGYYHAVIIPHAVTAFEESQDFSLCVEHKNKKFELELTRENMDLFLKIRYAAKTGTFVTKGDMDKAECAAYEDWCIKWIAHWLGYQIPPPDKDWRESCRDSTTDCGE